MGAPVHCRGSLASREEGGGSRCRKKAWDLNRISLSFTQGAAVATALTLAFQAWAVTGRLLYGHKPPRMPVTLDRCQLGGAISLSTSFATNRTEEAEIFPVFRLSSYWGGLFSALATVAIGLAISVLTGGGKDVKRHLPFTSDAFIRLWRRLQLLTGTELDHDGQARSHENGGEDFTMENKLHVSTTKL